ncbi:MAG TPA: hypothetical protein VKB80_35905 [Kofleriaceae bacterium]|nr:hypothetical protein [Kofleriaceae bacterium]
MNRRVIAVTADPGLGRTLRTATTAAGAEVREIPSAAAVEAGPLAAELLVFHWARQVDGGEDWRAELALAELAELADRLPPEGHVIVLLPGGDLATSVTAMRAHARVAGVMVADRLRSSELTAMTRRLLCGDIFGLDKVLPWGALVHSLSVGDSAEKAEAVQRISTFAASVGLRRVHRDRIERCCDEMMMNALYDAPPDGRAEGAVPPQNRAVVEYACDGQRFAVSVRDRFGRFERDTLLQYLHRCLHAEDQIEQKPGGAGLGLYFMSRSASALLFNVLPGRATECVCVFDIEAPRAELEQIGVFSEHVDEIGRLAQQPPRAGRHPVERRRARPSPAEAMPTELMPRLHAVPRRRPPGWVDRELDDERRRQRDRGELPARPLPLPPPPPTSDPSAQAARTLGLRGGGESLRSLAAAAALFVVGLSGLAIGLPHLYRAASSSADQPPAAPPVQGGAAPPGALTVTANVPGRVVVMDSPACSDRPLPLESCPLADGQHTVVVESRELHLRHAVSVEVRGAPVELALRLGFVEARPGYRIRAAPGEAPVARIALPEGRQTVTLGNQAPGSWLELQVPVRVDETVLVP